MKNYILLAMALLFAGFSALAQEETTDEEVKIWTQGGEGIITFSNTGFGDYWSAGGQSNTAVSGIFNAYKNKAVDDVAWDNNLRFEYGQSKIAGGDFEKVADIIDLNSKYGKGISGSSKWYYSGIFNLLTQLTNTDATDDSGQLIGVNGGNFGPNQSKIFAPADILLGLGVDFRPNDHFSSNLAPLTGRLRVIGDDRIAESQVYGNEFGKSTLPELGASWISQLNKSFLHNDMLSVGSKLSFFSAYNNNPDNIDVNFNNLTTLNPWKFITLTHSFDLLYDDDQRMTAFADGSVLPGSKEYTKNLQTKNYIGLGLTHKFGDSKE